MSKLISKHMVCSLQIMHLSCIKISTISKIDQTEHPLEPLHRSTNRCFKNGFLDYGALGANHAPILHQNQHCLQIDRSKIPYDTHHLEVPLGASKLISKHMVCSLQIMNLSCYKISTISKQIKPSFHLSLFTEVPTGASKMVS